MSLLLADKYPLFMMILTIVTLLFVIQYIRHADQAKFEKRVQWLKVAACVALFILVCGYGVRLIITLFFSINYFKINIFSGLIILYDPFVRLVYAYIIFKIVKISLQILNNFSKLKIFNQQNIDAIVELNQSIMKLLAVRILFNIIYCIFMILIDIDSNHAFESLNGNFDSIFGILCLFILMLIISAVTTIYTKAVDQYNENSLII